MRYAIMLVLPLVVAACGGGPPDVETLAFIRGADLWLVAADGSNERRITQFAGTGREVVGFEWLANGQGIAYEVGPPTDTVTAVLANADGTVTWQRELPAFTVGVFWSPDGQRVAVRDETSLSIENRSGRSIWTETLQPPEAGLEDTSTEVVWSRDGKALAFVDGEDIVVVSGDPETARRLDAFSAGCPAARTCYQPAVYGTLAFAPDGGSLVVPVKGGAPFGVYRVHLDSASEPPLLLSERREKGDVGSSLPSNTAFSPDGLYVAYTTGARITRCLGRGELVILEAAGDSVRSLVPREIKERDQELREARPPLYGPEHFQDSELLTLGFDWAPRGDAVLIAYRLVDCSSPDPSTVDRRTVAEGIYALRVDGTSEEKLSDEFPTFAPVWSPAGGLIAFETEEGDASAIRLLDLTTRRTSLFTWGFQPAWQPQP